ncbi:MAG: YIP1 family protein, partial [Chloroflexi bacterium]|nr:YIP1 family protein [Chloroflexota bacterium]
LVLAWLLGGRPSAGSLFRLSGWALVPSIARLIVGIAVMIVAGRVPVQGIGRAFETRGAAAAASAGGGAQMGGGTQMGGGQQGNPGQFNPGGAGRFTGRTPTFFSLFRSNLLSTLDIYSLWALVLTGIGVAVVVRLSWIKSGIVAVGQWAIGLALSTLPALIAFALGGLVGGRFFFGGRFGG